MGFLALAALCARASAGDRRLAIIAAFALEYLVNLALASDRRAYLLNPWRMVDALRSSPALRVLRLARVILFGARARHGLVAGADMGIARAAPSH